MILARLVLKVNHPQQRTQTSRHRVHDLPGEDCLFFTLESERP